MLLASDDVELNQVIETLGKSILNPQKSKIMIFENNERIKFDDFCWGKRRSHTSQTIQVLGYWF